MSVNRLACRKRHEIEIWFNLPAMKGITLPWPAPSTDTYEKTGHPIEIGWPAMQPDEHMVHRRERLRA